MKKNIIREKSWNRLMLCYQEYFSPALQQFLRNPDLFLAEPIKYFKNIPGDTSLVALIKIENKLLVVKRYNVKTSLHKIKLWFRQSRAMTSWKNVEMLCKHHIPTVKPVALLEKRFGPLRDVAYFVYEYIDGTMCCDYFEKNSRLTDIFKKALISFSNTAKKMQAAYIYHRDCHHNNMIMNELGEVILLDLDHMKQYNFFKQRFAKSHKKDMAKFIKYLGDNKEAVEFFEECYSHPM